MHCLLACYHRRYKNLRDYYFNALYSLHPELPCILGIVEVKLFKI
jgi:hypothetical protein